MSTIFVTIGPSGSGKSTFSHDKWRKAPEDIIIVNRDKIRELLFGYTEATVNGYYVNGKLLSKLEKEVTIYEDSLIETALSKNKDVIVDATHLSKEYIERFKIWNKRIELLWFDTSLEVCLTRNNSRLRSVPAEAVVSQYNKYIQLRRKFKDNVIEPVTFPETNPKFKECVIFDIDGTLADHEGKRSPFDWSKVGQDSVKNYVKMALHSSYSSGIDIFIVSGRDSVCRPETIEWLKTNEIPFHKLYMRAEKDSRPDWIIKEEIWREISTHHNIMSLYDDRSQVVRRARGLGLKVNQVEYGNF